MVGTSSGSAATTPSNDAHRSALAVERRYAPRRSSQATRADRWHDRRSRASTAPSRCGATAGACRTSTRAPSTTSSSRRASSPRRIASGRWRCGVVQAEGRLAEVLGPRAVGARPPRAPLPLSWVQRTPSGPRTVRTRSAIVGAFVGRRERVHRAGEGSPADRVHDDGLRARAVDRRRSARARDRRSRACRTRRRKSCARDSSRSSARRRRPRRFSPPSRRARSIRSPASTSRGLDQSSLGGVGSAYSDIAFQRVEGSNNWVVSGKKTRSGKPILANDPHRAITHPSVRYITHLVGPGWNVIGAGEPASPGVSIGHNERIAFGLTIVGMDQQDVYVERVGAVLRERGTGNGERELEQPRQQQLPPPRSRSPASRCYFHNGGWQPITTVIDTIRVKGEPAANR